KLEAGIINATTNAEKETLLNQLASRIITPYIIMAIVLALLALLIKKSSLPEIETEDDPQARYLKTKTSVFQYPHLLLGVLCIFLYVGVEVMAGDAIGIYGRTIGITIDKTRYFTTFTLIAMLIGYIIGVATIPK